MRNLTNDTIFMNEHASNLFHVKCRIPDQKEELLAYIKYSIVITQKVPDGRYAFSMQYGIGEALAMLLDKSFWQEGIINKGESFICIDGEWLDLDAPELLEELSEGAYDLYKCDNFPIKGYSEKVAEMPVIKITGIDKLSLIEPNKSLTLSLRFHGPPADFPEEPKITWSVPDEYGETPDQKSDIRRRNQ